MTIHTTTLRADGEIQPSLAQLIERHAFYERNWTPANDGTTHDIADEIKVRVMAELGLPKAYVESLGAILT